MNANTSRKIHEKLFDVGISNNFFEMTLKAKETSGTTSKQRASIQQNKQSKELTGKL